MSEPHTNHIVAAYMRASQDDIATGLSWYDSAQSLARALDPSNVSRAAGVIAAMSPMTAWPENVKRATAALTTGEIRHTRPNVAKVQRILDGEHPLSVLNGPKTRAFYLNIMGDHSVDSVTVDRHAIDVACATVQSDSERAAAIRGKAGYAKVASMYVEAAQIIGDITPAQLQAVTWVWWRRTNAQNKYEDSK